MDATEAITNDEILDSRNIEERITYLEGVEEPSDEEQEEMTALLALRDEAQQYSPDWRFGATLIREDYMQTYAQECAEDMGCMPKDNSWPASFIDWDAATDAFKLDYTEVTFGDDTYYIR